MKQLLDLLGFRNSCSLPRLLEGLPHPGGDPELFEKERRRTKVVRIHWEWFYKEPLRATPELLHSVAEILRDMESFRPWQPKRCLFHADYAFKWLDGNVTRQVLICFGCGEAKRLGPFFSSAHYDLSPEAVRHLGYLLEDLQHHRPVREVPNEEL